MQPRSLVAIAALTTIVALGSVACGDTGWGASAGAPASSPSPDQTSGLPSGSPGGAEVAAFTSYAVGEGTVVPWADAVTYRIAGEPVARLDAGRAGRREAWVACPAGATSYEGRDCPVSVLRTIAQVGREGGTLILETTAPRTVGCNRHQAPAEADAASTTWIRPDEQHRSCFSDFAVAVSLDESGRVVAVDLALSGP